MTPTARLEQLQKLAAIAPDDPLAHYGLGLEFINLQRWEDAVAAFNQAIAVDGRYSAAFYHKARAEIAAGNAAAGRATLTAGMEVARAAGDWHTQEEMKALLDTLA
jgi:tetratricopeptide (TPR) repeat protein